MPGLNPGKGRQWQLRRKSGRAVIGTSAWKPAIREVSSKLANWSTNSRVARERGLRGTADSVETCLRRERLTDATGVSVGRADILPGDGSGQVVILVDTASGTGGGAMAV